MRNVDDRETRRQIGRDSDGIVLEWRAIWLAPDRHSKLGVESAMEENVPEVAGELAGTFLAVLDGYADANVLGWSERVLRLVGG